MNAANPSITTETKLSWGGTSIQTPEVKSTVNPTKKRTAKKEREKGRDSLRITTTKRKANPLVLGPF